MEYKTRFITIGYIEQRKAQDLLVDAIDMLQEEISGNAEFLIIGQNISLLAQKLAERIGADEKIKMLGPVSRGEVHRLLEQSDVLICPSREDPMPTVCAEAMMHGVPCLVSDATGTAHYIHDGYDGLVFESENASDLKDKINWCVHHRGELKIMGKRAYEIYESIFSIRAFEQNLLMHVEDMIGKAEN